VLRLCVWSRNIKNGCCIYIYIYDISRLRVKDITLTKPVVRLLPQHSVGGNLKITKPCSLVSSSTRFELDGPGIDSLWERDFAHPSKLTLGLTRSPELWVSCLFPRGKEAGAWRWWPPKSSTEVKESVELYSNSPSGLSKAYFTASSSFYHLLLHHSQSSRSSAWMKKGYIPLYHCANPLGKRFFHLKAENLRHIGGKNS